TRPALEGGLRPAGEAPSGTITHNAMLVHQAHLWPCAHYNHPVTQSPHITIGSGERGAMPTVKLVPEDSPHPIVREQFTDIKITKKTDFAPAIGRALAPPPEHLRLCWTRLKAIMQPGKVDLLTKEIVALAVSVTNSCRYCINSHTAAAQKLGL